MWAVKEISNDRKLYQGHISSEGDLKEQLMVLTVAQQQ
jgi:hypothetical protein